MFRCSYSWNIFGILKENVIGKNLILTSFHKHEGYNPVWLQFINMKLFQNIHILDMSRSKNPDSEMPPTKFWFESIVALNRGKNRTNSKLWLGTLNTYLDLFKPNIWEGNNFAYSTQHKSAFYLLVVVTDWRDSLTKSVHIPLPVTVHDTITVYFRTSA